MPPRFLKPSLAGYQPYQPGEQPGDGEGWIKLNTNESPYPPSPRVLEAIRAAVGDDLRLYPDPIAAPARKAIAAAFGLEPDRVALGNGADELIEMCFRAFCAKGGQVSYPEPSYPLLDPLCDVHEAVRVTYPAPAGWGLPSEFVSDRSPLKFLVNPNSPTGTWHPREVVEEVVREAAGVVVLDEAYVDFAPEPRLDLLAGNPNLIILRTFSKSGALAGMRVGYALAHPDLIAALDAVKDSYNLNRLAIAAACAAIEDGEHRRGIVAAIVRDRDWLSGELAGLGFAVEPSAANFVFVQPPESTTAPEVAAGLRERRILVRHYRRPPIDSWLRITVGTRSELESLVDALNDILGGL